MICHVKFICYHFLTPVWSKGVCSHLEFDFQVVDIHHFILWKRDEPSETDNAPYALETGVLRKLHRNE